MAGRSDHTRLTLGLGIFGYVPAPEVVRIVRLADELGVRNAWIGDSQVLWREAYSVLGACAVQTERIVLGPGVSNVTTRHVSVIASALLTLFELSEGRVAAGLGTGDSSMRTLGRKPVSREVLADRIGTLRALLAGAEARETLDDSQDGHSYTLAYGADDAGPASIPIYVAAGTPRSLELAGRIADGVILCVGSTPDSIETAIDHVQAGAEAAGRSLDDIHRVLWTPISVNEDAKAARDAVRVYVAGNVNIHAPSTNRLTEDEKAAIAAVRDQYHYRNHMSVAAGHAASVPDSLVAKVAIAGTVEDCRQRVREIAGTRVQQIGGVPAGATAEDRPRVIEEFTRHVFDAVVPELEGAISRQAEG
ncbi:MAG: LLM class flavin-dependent oxidoreductase [Gaiellaceae bacterium]